MGSEGCSMVLWWGAEVGSTMGEKEVRGDYEEKDI